MRMSLMFAAVTLLTGINLFLFRFSLYRLCGESRPLLLS